jgi:hypothetical protein
MEVKLIECFERDSFDQTHAAAIGRSAAMV